MTLVVIAIKVKNINPLSKAALNIISFPKNPIKGGIPIKEKIVIAKLIDNTGFI